MRKLIGLALLLYPRTVRANHGAELESLVEELIERDGASPPAVITRLAADGLAQRMTSRTTAWVVGVTLALTSFGGLAVSDFAAASAHQARPPMVGAQNQVRSQSRVRVTPHIRLRLPDAGAHRTSRRSAGIIAR